MAIGDDDVRRHLRRIETDVELGGVSLGDEVAGGKLLRARLVLAAAALGRAPDAARAVRYAVLVELIHAGALFHDDVVDCSRRRRGRPTLWSRAGVRPAVLAGLGLMVRGGAALGASSPELRRVVGDSLRDVARGQTDELLQLFAIDISPEAYRRRARAKTGALYELAARLGAEAGGLDASAADVVARFAARVGLAFQLADDVRDLLGGPALGRPPGTDLQTGVFTLPILLTTSGRFPGGDRLRTLLHTDRDAPTLAACVDVLVANGAVAETVREARLLLDGAVDALGFLPASPARAALGAYAHELVGTLPADLRPDWSTAGEPGDPPVASHDPHERPSFAPALATALHPTLPASLRRLAEHAALAPAAARVAAAGATLAVLGDGSQSSWRERAAAVGTVDLLVGEFFHVLAALPAQAAAGACEALARLLLAAAEDAARPQAEPVPVVGDEMLAAFADAVRQASC